ncbi:hypothetical protein CHS0354_038673 [Potamilus streckersoni]|uniref:Uncharacterized protein n=1 Tax=Potamilus streckersoni TaxID=2493646 RepID=A0AAE0W8P1_9BIVA|nr:hypothetical protein CHS0354_038673 [Potamilus streckersoni]
MRSGHLAFFFVLIMFANSQIMQDCRRLIDVVIVLDGSDSISADDFKKLQKNVIDLINQLNIGHEEVWFGIVIYSAGVYMYPLSGDKEELRNITLNLIHDRDRTNTALGIRTMRQLLAHGRSGVPKIGIVVTDGISKNSTETSLEALAAQSEGVRMYSVGVGNLVDHAELKSIASATKNVFAFSNFSQLSLDAVSSAIEICPKECRQLIDLIVVIDGSDSISSEDFQTLKFAIVNLMEGMVLSDDDVKLGLVLYSSNVTNTIPLSGNKADLKGKIIALPHPRDGTRTDLGIAMMTEMFGFQGRTSAARIGIVITDGISMNRTETTNRANRAKAEGINMFAVGVTNLVDNIELDAIASSPVQVLSVDSFDQLKNNIFSLLSTFCKTEPTGTKDSSVAGVSVPNGKHIPGGECRQLIDLIVVIDGSDSISSEDFKTLKFAIVNLMEGMVLSDDDVKLGLVLYSSNVTNTIPLSGDKADLKEKIIALPHPRDGTRTDLGIAMMTEMFGFQGRTSAVRIGIVITDGISMNRTETTNRANRAKDEKVNMFAVGVTNLVDNIELDAIASSPVQVLSVDSFDQLKNNIISLLSTFCKIELTGTTNSSVAGLAVPNVEQIPGGECRHIMDLIVVVDGSDSISTEEFDTLKLSIRNLTEAMTLSDDEVKLGLVLYSSNVSNTVPLSADKANLKEKILALPHPRDGTRTDLGIAMMTEMFSSQGRSSAQRFGIVITDGISMNRTETTLQANRAKKKGINMFAIGVTNFVDNIELESIASSSAQVLSVDGFDRLKSNIFMLLSTFCATGYIPGGAYLCEGCRMNNGAGFNNHPTDCDKFVQCFPGVNGTLRAEIQQCPFGTYWFLDLFTCLPIADVYCVTDKCNHSSIMAYGHDKICQAYYECTSGGKSVPKCCSSGHRFSNGRGCVPDPSCVAPCEVNVNSTHSCDMRAVADHPSMFEQHIEGWGWIKMACAPGTSFFESSCTCAFFDDSWKEKAECKPEIYLPFDVDSNDKSGLNSHVQNSKVVVHKGVAYFDGTARLVIPRFTNLDYGTTLIIKIRYRSDPDNKMRSLISNADCGITPAILISENKEELNFGVDTDNDSFKHVTLPNAVREWKNITYIFHNGKLEGRSPDQKEEISVKGAIENHQCAIQIGHSQGLDMFIGEIDELSIYLCRPDGI